MTTKPSFQTIINAVKSLLNKSNNPLKKEFYTNILDLRHRLSESDFDFDFDNFTINGWTPDLAVFPNGINTCLILSVNQTYDNEHDGSTTCHTFVQGLDEYILLDNGLFSYPSVNSNNEETEEDNTLMFGEQPFSGESQPIQNGQQWIREILTECQNIDRQDQKFDTKEPLKFYSICLSYWGGEKEIGTWQQILDLLDEQKENNPEIEFSINHETKTVYQQNSAGNFEPVSQLLTLEELIPQEGFILNEPEFGQEAWWFTDTDEAFDQITGCFPDHYLQDDDDYDETDEFAFGSSANEKQEILKESLRRLERDGIAHILTTEIADTLENTFPYLKLRKIELYDNDGTYSKYAISHDDFKEICCEVFEFNNELENNE